MDEDEKRATLPIVQVVYDDEFAPSATDIGTAQRMPEVSSEV